MASKFNLEVGGGHPWGDAEAVSPPSIVHGVHGNCACCQHAVAQGEEGRSPQPRAPLDRGSDGAVTFAARDMIMSPHHLMETCTPSAASGMLGHVPLSPPLVGSAEHLQHRTWRAAHSPHFQESSYLGEVEIGQLQQPHQSSNTQ